MINAGLKKAPAVEQNVVVVAYLPASEQHHRRQQLVVQADGIVNDRGVAAHKLIPFEHGIFETSS